MGIENFIKRTCKQTAVYWGNPTNDGSGGFTFDDPIEIICRWEDRNDIFLSPTGKELNSKAVIYSIQDLDENGFVYLGTIDDLYDLYGDSLGAIDDPKMIESAFAILRFDKTPVLGSTTEFMRKSFLTSKNMW
jgi:hypothetical protein